jgi:hypothetical protein
MADVDPVEIVVDIIDQFSDDLRELSRKLERIDAKSLNIDLDVQASGEIASTEAQLDAMARDRTVGIRTRIGGVPGTGGDDDGGIPVPSISRPGGGRGNLMLGGTGAMRMIGRGGGGGGLSSLIPDDALEQSRQSFRRLGSVVGRLTPNIMMVWNVLAAGIPIMVSLGAAAIGLAGALGTVAVAGAAILGVGLLGFGDSFSASISNATTELQNLGSTLFDVLQPVARTFQPILQGWLEGAPRQVQQLVGPMQGLAVFADTLSAAGAGIVDWIAEAVSAMVAMDDVINQMVLRLGAIAGDFLINWMENMVQFAYDNQTAMIQLAGVVRDLFGALLDISVVAATTLSQFSFLTDILAFFADMLNTRVGRTIVMAVALLVSFETALAAAAGVVGILNANLGVMAAGIASKYLPMVSQAIASTWAWISSLSTLRAVLASTGIGLAVIGGGLLANELLFDDAGPSGGAGTRGGGGGGGGTYINVQGDVGRRELDRVLDQTGGVARQEISITEDMSQ